MKKRILLVEDDLMYVKPLHAALTREGFAVLHARNGEEGVEQATEELPHLIVLDLTLPQKDGFQVLDALKADPQTKDIPVVMLTHLSAKEDVDRCLRAGACEYLIKVHHTPEDLVRVIRRVLKIPT